MKFFLWEVKKVRQKCRIFNTVGTHTHTRTHAHTHTFFGGGTVNRNCSVLSIIISVVDLQQMKSRSTSLKFVPLRSKLQEDKKKGIKARRRKEERIGKKEHASLCGCLSEKDER